MLFLIFYILASAFRSVSTKPMSLDPYWLVVGHTMKQFPRTESHVDSSHYLTEMNGLGIGLWG